MLTTIHGVGVDVLSACVSKQRISVEERCKELISGKKAARLIKGTGFSHLSVVPIGVCTSDLCVKAAEQIFESGFSRDEIGAIIFLSQYPDYTSPATSFVIQSRLGISNDILGFDVNLGCSGFIYGIYLAASLLSNIGKKVLLLVGDTTSMGAYPNDLAFLSIAGDAGAAAVIGRRNSNEMSFNLTSYGNKWRCLLTPRGGARAWKRTDEQGNLLPEKENYAVMDGTEVMNFSTYETADNVQELLDYLGINSNALDIALFHQANKMIVETLGEKLGIPREKVPFRSEEIGNTSSASIPVCLTEIAKCGEYRPYKKALLSGFGVGMSAASTVMDLSDTKVLETCEYE